MKIFTLQDLFSGLCCHIHKHCFLYSCFHSLFNLSYAGQRREEVHLILV